MKKTVICAICGKVFTTDKPNKRYCGISCRVKAIQQNRKEWTMRNPDYMRDYMREYRQKRKQHARG